MDDEELLKILQTEFYDYEVEKNQLDSCFSFILKLKNHDCIIEVTNYSYYYGESDIIIFSFGGIVLKSKLKYLQESIRLYKKDIDNYIISYYKTKQSRDKLYELESNSESIIKSLIRNEKINKII